MRLAGAVTDIHGLGRHDHVCWLYGQLPEYGAAAARFLLDGLERGERLLCVGDAAIRTATEGESALPDAAELVRTGRLDLLPLPESHRTRQQRRSVREQLQFYSTAVEQALADGFAGLRVAAEVSDLPSGPAEWSAQVEWEQAADRFIAGGPGMTTLCAYRVDVVDEAMRQRLLQVHPLAGGAASEPAFRLYSAGDALVLTGEVDSFTAEELADRLESAPRDGGAMALDVSGLAFADAAAVSTIEAWRRRCADRGVDVQLRGASSTLRRVRDALGHPPL